MTIGLLAFLARQETKPNSAIFSEDGVVLLRKDTLRSNCAAPHRLVFYDRVSKWFCPRAILANCEAGQSKLRHLPLRKSQQSEFPWLLLLATKKESNFLKCSISYGRNIEIDNAVLETLAPRVEESYTSLWLSAIETAPNLGQLLPLADGEKLKHDFVIEKQFSSGGQAVTYLASRSDEPGAKVILKEFLLPLFIESARKKVTERFERDARLLKTSRPPTNR
jgi:hypothetical protein